MPKIKIKAEIINNSDKQTIETDAILQNDILKYLENDNTKVVLNLEDKTLIRENDKIKMYYSFSNNKGLIEIKEFNKIVDLDIKVKEVKRNGNNIRVNYEIEKDEFTYQVGEIK